MVDTPMPDIFGAGLAELVAELLAVPIAGPPALNGRFIVEPVAWPMEDTAGPTVGPSPLADAFRRPYRLASAAERYAAELLASKAPE